MGDVEPFSIVEVLGNSGGHSCGYCRGKPKAPDDTKEKTALGEDEEKAETMEEEDYGAECIGAQIAMIRAKDFEQFLDRGWRAWAHRLKVEDYLELMKRGWRRSGSYLYKPSMAVTCCPQYTIRLDVNKFVLSRTQKRVLRNMRTFLETGEKVKPVKEEPREGLDVQGGRVPDGSTVEQLERLASGAAPATTVKERKSTRITEKPKETEARMEQESLPQPVPQRREKGEKRKELRKKRAIERWTFKGIDVRARQAARSEKEAARRATLDQRIHGKGTEPKTAPAHKLVIERVRVDSPEFRDRADETFLLFKKYQESIHKDDEVTRIGYERFLVKTPLRSSSYDFGSFHHRFILDGKIIAVGVCDVLPHSLSSKYLFYDPDYAFLTLGTYTALREIQFVIDLARYSISRDRAPLYPELHYYYMGYYIPTCPKMRYKGRFRPSDLLCDRTFEWVPLKEADAKLAANDNLFTNFIETGNPADCLDPERTLVYQDAVIRPFDTLTIDEKEAALPKVSLICSAMSPSMMEVVLLVKELQGLNVDDDDSS